MKRLAIALALMLTAAPAVAETLPIVPLTITMPPGKRVSLRTACHDCGIHQPTAEETAQQEREVDSRQAILLYNARNGGPDHWRELGMDYISSVAYDTPRGLMWLTRAANAGDIDAMITLAQLYRYGTSRGIKQDSVQTEYWYTQAAEAGSLSAMLNLAVLYGEGNILPQDSGKAQAWYLRAAATGDPYAQAAAGAFFARVGDANRSFDYYMRAHDLGYTDVGPVCEPDPGLSADRRIRSLAVCSERNTAGTYYPALVEALLSGDNLPRDVPRAVVMLKNGLRRGDIQAATTLARLYDQGIGVEADINEVARLFAYAAGKGQAEARAWVDAHPDNVSAAAVQVTDLSALPPDQQAAVASAILTAFGDAAENYPERALGDEIEGEAVIDCGWTAAGDLENCLLIEEMPKTYNFGAQAVKLTLRMAHPVLPITPAPGSHSVLQLVWRFE